MGRKLVGPLTSDRTDGPMLSMKQDLQPSKTHLRQLLSTLGGSRSCRQMLEELESLREDCRDVSEAVFCGVVSTAPPGRP